jgi:hypothetical protein
METERQKHLARIYQLIEELERSDPSERKVIDLVVERKMRQTRALWRLHRLSQVTGPQGRNPVRSAGPDENE